MKFGFDWPSSFREEGIIRQIGYGWDLVNTLLESEYYF